MRSNMGRLGRYASVGSLGFLMAGAAAGEVTYRSSWGTSGAGAGQINLVTGIAVDPTSGEVFIADTTNNRITRYTRSGTHITNWSSTVSQHIDVGPLGRVFVMEGTTVRRYNNVGGGLFSWGLSGTGSDIAVDAVGNVAVVRGNDDALTFYDSNGVPGFGLTCIVASPDCFDNPTGIGGFGDGFFYLADKNNNRVQGRLASLHLNGIIGAGPGGAPGQLQGPERIDVSDNHRVYVFEVDNARVQIFASTGELLGLFDGPSTGRDPFIGISDIAVSHTGDVYLADRSNDRIHRFFDSDAWSSGSNTFADAAVGPDELLGQSQAITSSKQLFVTNQTTVQPDSTLAVDGGLFSTDSLAVQGEQAEVIVRGIGSVVAVSNTTTVSDHGAISVEGGSVSTGGLIVQGPDAELFVRGDGAAVGITGDTDISSGGSLVVGGRGVQRPQHPQHGRRRSGIECPAARWDDRRQRDPDCRRRGVAARRRGHAHAPRRRRARHRRPRRRPRLHLRAAVRRRRARTGSAPDCQRGQRRKDRPAGWGVQRRELPGRSRPRVGHTDRAGSLGRHARRGYDRRRRRRVAHDRRHVRHRRPGRRRRRL